MQKIKSVIYVALIASAGLLVVLINPLVAFLASVSIIAVLMISMQGNLYKMAMMLKRYAKKVTVLQAEIRAKLHTGLLDYNESLENLEDSRHGSRGFVK